MSRVNTFAPVVVTSPRFSTPTFHNWLIANRTQPDAAPLYLMLEKSGYLNDPDFVRRHADSDFANWRWFFTWRGISKEVFRQAWCRWLRETESVR